MLSFRGSGWGRINAATRAAIPFSLDLDRNIVRVSTNSVPAFGRTEAPVGAYHRARPQESGDTPGALGIWRLVPCFLSPRKPTARYCGAALCCPSSGPWSIAEREIEARQLVAQRMWGTSSARPKLGTRCCRDSPGEASFTWNFLSHQFVCELEDERGSKALIWSRYAQAWRKRSSLPYTRWLSQCCDYFNDSSVPSDALIRPLVQASELLSRISTYFSYDDVENAEVKGETMLNLSVNNFSADLTHIKESLSPLLKHSSKCILENPNK
jgi:hypothetical protein